MFQKGVATMSANPRSLFRFSSPIRFHLSYLRSSGSVISSFYGQSSCISQFFSFNDSSPIKTQSNHISGRCLLLTSACLGAIALSLYSTSTAEATEPEDHCVRMTNPTVVEKIKATKAFQDFAARGAVGSRLQEFFDALSIENPVLAQNFLVLSPQFRTPIHQHLFEYLFHMSNELSSGALFGQTGRQTDVLVGNRGAGKSTILKTTALMAGVYHPDVIGVYIECVQMYSNPLSKESLCAILLRKLKSQYHYGYDPNANPFNELMRVLRANKRRLFLLIDEADNIYKASPEKPDVWKAACAIADELDGFGNHPEGLTYVALCGSSPVLPRLINLSAQDDRYLAKKYPLLASAPDLNSTKYKTRKYYAALPTNVKSVQSISGIPASYSALINKITFLAGSIPRQVQHTIRNSAQVRTDADIVDTESDQYFHQPSICRPKRHIFTEFHQRLMERLWKKNHEILDSLLVNEGKHASISWSKVGTGDWVNVFEPLTIEEVHDIWANLTHHPTDHVDSSLEELAANDAIILQSTSSDNMIYPISVYQLYQCHLQGTESISHFLLNNRKGDIQIAAGPVKATVKYEGIKK